MYNRLGNVLHLAHWMVEQVLQRGDQAVDATAGNGHDTVHLARLVGPEGKVWAFDIQDQALKATAQRLNQAGVEDRVTIIQASHVDLTRYVDGRPRAVMFNLGYLPGGDHSITTLSRSTLAAVEAARRLLLPGGIITVVAYPGHEEGAVEARALEEDLSRLCQQEWHVVKVAHVNGNHRAPFLLALKRLGYERW